MGMDIVKRIAVDELGGELSLRHDARARARTFMLRVPLTIAIVDAFSFRARRRRFVVPVAMVEEIVEVDPAAVRVTPPAPRGGARAARMLERRGEAVPARRRSTTARPGAGDSGTRARRSSCGATASRSPSRSTACSASRRWWCVRSRTAGARRAASRLAPTSATGARRWSSTWLAARRAVAPPDGGAGVSRRCTCSSRSPTPSTSSRRPRSCRWSRTRARRRCPGAAAVRRGLVQVRGRVVPVVDLRARFGLPAIAPTLDSRVVVVQSGERTVGLLVDSAREVLKHRAGRSSSRRRRWSAQQTARASSRRWRRRATRLLMLDRFPEGHRRGARHGE